MQVVNTNLLFPSLITFNTFLFYEYMQLRTTMLVSLHVFGQNVLMITKHFLKYIRLKIFLKNLNRRYRKEKVAPTLG